MIELKPIVQVVTGVSFFGMGIYLLFSKRLKSANFFKDDRLRKVSGGFLITLGIYIALLMVVLQQPRVWQVGSNLMYAAAAISLLFSGVYNLCYRQKKSAECNVAKSARIVGYSLILLGVWSGILFFLSVFSWPKFMN